MLALFGNVSQEYLPAVKSDFLSLWITLPLIRTDQSEQKNSKLYPLFCVTRNNYMEVLQKGMLIYKLNVFTDQFWLILKVYQSDFKNGYIFLSFL